MRISAVQEENPLERANQSGKPLKPITIDTRVVRNSLRFQRGTLQGKSIVVVDAVRIGSPAESLGIKPGQILVAISDPIQGLDTLWPVEEKTSLRFLMDAVRVSTSGKIKLVLQDPDPTEPAPRLEGGPMEIPTGSGGRYIGVQEAGGTLEGRDSIDLRQKSQVAANVRKRIDAREEMLNTVGKRNDVPFLLTLAAVLVLPGLIGLAIAFFSGYEFLK